MTGLTTFEKYSPHTIAPPLEFRSCSSPNTEEAVVLGCRLAIPGGETVAAKSREEFGSGFLKYEIFPYGEFYRTAVAS